MNQHHLCKIIKSPIKYNNIKLLIKNLIYLYSFACNLWRPEQLAHLASFRYCVGYNFAIVWNPGTTNPSASLNRQNTITCLFKGLMGCGAIKANIDRQTSCTNYNNSLPQCTINGTSLSRTWISAHQVWPTSHWWVSTPSCTFSLTHTCTPTHIHVYMAKYKDLP